MQAGRISGSDGFWSPDSGSSRGGRTGERRGAALTHRCAVYCIFRGISGGGANSQIPEFENLHRFSQNLNLRKTQRLFFVTDETRFTSDDLLWILVRLAPQSLFWSSLRSLRTALDGGANSQIFENLRLGSCPGMDSLRVDRSTDSGAYGTVLPIYLSRPWPLQQLIFLPSS